MHIATAIVAAANEAEAIRAEIARLTRQRREWNILGLSNHETDADIAAEIADLEGDLEVIERPELYA